METNKTELYMSLYCQADELIKKHNPCQVENGRCKRGKFCCNGCTYLIDNKCVVKSILCKTWLCGQLAYTGKLPKELLDGLKHIFAKALDKHFLVIRGGMDDALLFDPFDKTYFKNMIVDMPWGEPYMLRTPKKNQCGGL